MKKTIFAPSSAEAWDGVVAFCPNDNSRLALVVIMIGMLGMTILYTSQKNGMLM